MDAGKPAAGNSQKDQTQKKIGRDTEARDTDANKSISMQPTITMYATRSCPYCMAARTLLTRKALVYEEILISGDTALRDEMQRRSGRTSVPQIFIDDRAIGGFDELNALEQSGELDQLLTTSSTQTSTSTELTQQE